MDVTVEHEDEAGQFPELAERVNVPSELVAADDEVIVAGCRCGSSAPRR